MLDALLRYDGLARGWLTAHHTTVLDIVMVALTGNYKADQVHVPALLDRMGRER